MTGRTHDLAAFTALNLVIVTQNIPQLSLSTSLVALGACFIGGLTPDIDQPTSGFWSKIPAGNFLGRIFHPFIGRHRNISHSLLGMFLFGILVKHLLNLASSTLLVNMNVVWWGFMIGFFSHLVMDSFTEEGVPWLFPIPIHFGIPPFRALRLKTAGLIEKILIFPGLLILNGYFFYNFYPIYISLFKSIIK